MLILKRFSRPEPEGEKSRENALTTLGKVSLGVSGAALGAAGVEYGRAAKGFMDVKKSGKDIVNLAENPEVRGLLKSSPIIQRASESGPGRFVRGAGNNTLRFFKNGGWEHNKFNTGVLLFKTADKASMATGRGILQNAGNLSRFAIEEGLRSPAGKVVSKSTQNQLRSVVPSVAGKVGKSLLHFRNARRVFTPIALAAGGLGFTSYAAGKTAEQSGNRRSETKNFSYQAEISKFIRKKGRNLNAIEKANLTDAFEGVIERRRGRQARRIKQVNQARKHMIGSNIPKTITNSDSALEAAKKVAEKNTFHRQEEELIRKRAKKIKI